MANQLPRVFHILQEGAAEQAVVDLPPKVEV